MKVRLCNHILNAAGCLLSFWALSSCGDSAFTAKVEKTAEPDKTFELNVEKIETDHLYSEYFATYDSVLISSCPNSPEFLFYVSDLKNNELSGAFMRKGQGPGEYLGLTPIKRIERRGNDLIALTYEPHKRKLLEWNITQSIETGKDSIVSLGFYENSNDYDFTYSAMYKIGDSKYLGYTPGFSQRRIKPLLPTYWVLEGQNAVPTHGISVVKRMIDNKDSQVAASKFFNSTWCLSPDNTKIADAMSWLKQINIIDLATNDVKSYRMKDSPGEGIFEGEMEYASYQYHNVVCDDNSIYALYFGEPLSTYKDTLGCYWLHEFDWTGKFKKKYRLPVPLVRLWVDSSNNTLYGYSTAEDAIYKLKVN
ncbi:MAG: hypothetical protein K2M11_08710 [Paramuribaculum sp.]|nr:hypothetical protein [Paramuribaculum sp.]